MPTYDILKDFNAGTAPDKLGFTGSSCIAVFRRKYPATYSRKNKKSIARGLGIITELKGVMVIVDDIAQVTVNTTKSNHVSTLAATLRPGLNYISEILPGDFVFCWMAQDKETIDGVVKKIGLGQSCSEWSDGLKFFGRVGTCRKRARVVPNTGTRLTNFTLTALGFTELDSKLYYEPYMQLPQFTPAVGFMQYYGIKINELITAAKGATGGSFETDDIVPAIYRVLFGSGAKPFRGDTAKRAYYIADGKNEEGGNSVHVSEGLDNPNIFTYPQEIAAIFGKKTGSKPDGRFGLIDIMDFIHGVQEYQGGSDKPVDVFSPNVNWEPDIGTVGFTGNKLMGTFLPNLPAMNGAQPVWSLLNQFVNSAVNEMYATLRVNPEGKVVPTLILRQLPFSSGLVGNAFVPPDELSFSQRQQERQAKAELAAVGGEYSKAGLKLLQRANARQKKNQNKFEPLLAPAPPAEQPLATTKFLELPRWRIPGIFVKDFDVGRSDAMRVNFIHVYGEAGTPTGIKPSDQFVRDPPIRDDLDILRSGLRPYMATVACGPTDLVKRAPGAWMHLLADILMNQELTLTGTMSTHGIPQPICPGDNLEYDGVVAHIESVSHSFSSDGTGSTSFQTTLQLTHGVSAEQASDDDFALYAGLASSDLSSYDPAVVREGDGLTVGNGDGADNLAPEGQAEDVQRINNMLDGGSS